MKLKQIVAVAATVIYSIFHWQTQKMKPQDLYFNKNIYIPSGILKISSKSLTNKYDIRLDPIKKKGNRVTKCHDQNKTRVLRN